MGMNLKHISKLATALQIIFDGVRNENTSSINNFQRIGRMAFNEREPTDSEPETVVILSYKEEPGDPVTQSSGEGGLPDCHQDQQEMLWRKQGTKIHSNQGRKSM